MSLAGGYERFLAPVKPDPFRVDVGTATKAKRLKKKPTVIEWKGEKMLRHNSLMYHVRKIADRMDLGEYATIGILGVPDTGKSTIARTIAHILHEWLAKKYNLTFAVHEWGKPELTDLATSLQSLKGHSIILFDDISYLTKQISAKKYGNIEAAVTEIRHRPDGQEIKVVILYMYHYSKAVGRLLRGTDYYFLTGYTASERSNMQELMGNRNLERVQRFAAMRRRAVVNQQWKDGPKGEEVTYKFRRPFAPALFYDMDRVYTVIYPRREWLAPKCTICAHAMDDKPVSTVNVWQAMDGCAKKYGRSHAITAVKFKMASLGQNAYGTTTKYAIKYLDSMFGNSIFSFNEVQDWIEHNDPRATRKKAKPEDDPAPAAQP